MGGQTRPMNYQYLGSPKKGLYPKGLSTMNHQLLDSQGPILGMTPTQALITIQTMADHSQKWHDGTTSRNIRSSSSNVGLAALVNKLDNDSFYSTHLYSNPNTDPSRMPLTKAKGQIPQKDKIHKIESMIKRFRKRYSRVVCPNEAAIESNPGLMRN
ncbi:hypothetical protein Tco_0113014 [Tanacetum coccineum]